MGGVGAHLAPVFSRNQIDHVVKTHLPLNDYPSPLMARDVKNFAIRQFSLANSPAHLIFSGHCKGTGKSLVSESDLDLNLVSNTFWLCDAGTVN